MERFKFLSKSKVSHLPKTPGVYVFKNNRELLYIGKAADIKNRVKNHFHPHTKRSYGVGVKQPVYRDGLFLNKIKKIGYIKTDSEIEALLLEANLIKKYQPKYNILWRDDKNYFYVGVTKENFPRIIITHQPTISHNSRKSHKAIKASFTNTAPTASKASMAQYLGPFVEGSSLKKTLRVLRKIFPYYTVKKHPKGPCPYCHIGFCPGPNPNLKEYKKNIKNLVAVLKGKKKSVLKNLKKEMETVSKKQEFEKAAKIRDQVFALEKVMAHTKIIGPPPRPEENWNNIQRVLQKIIKKKQKISRIEAYDISNIQGKQATGSMIVFIKGLPDKNFYRKFKIKIAGKPNDVAMIKEVLERRLSHSEWPYPDLILIDGGIAQLNAAVNVKNQELRIKSKVKVISLAKRKNELYIEGRGKPILLKKLPREIFNLILQLRDEAHRFALSYHHKLREIDLKLK